MDSKKKRLLYITDFREGTRESSVDYLFGRYLRDYMEVTRLYFSKEKTHEIKINEKDVTVPYEDRRRIDRHLNLSEYDFIIVRNRFDILSSLLKRKKKIRGKIGFQLTFPHSYRRKYQAREEKRAYFRKSIEYIIRHHFETKLLKSCDFFFPISQLMKDAFYPAINTPTFPLPMGVDCEPSMIETKNSIQADKNVKRFVYLGTVDPLRRMDRTFKALLPLKDEDWALDIYTKDTEYTYSILPRELHSKVRILDYVDRSILLKTLGNYHCGIFLLPETPLYNVASPTKVMDYYQAGIPALMSRIPECLELFDEKSGFFSNFEEKNISHTFSKILSQPLKDLEKMGKNGQKVLKHKRSYCNIAKDLSDFMTRQRVKRIS